MSKIIFFHNKAFHVFIYSLVNHYCTAFLLYLNINAVNIWDVKKKKTATDKQYFSYYSI